MLEDEGFGYGPEGGVQAGAVTATGQYAHAKYVVGHRP
jgi:hypothetical protein